MRFKTCYEKLVALYQLGESHENRRSYGVHGLVCCGLISVCFLPDGQKSGAWIMVDVALVQSGSNNGTATPATPGSLTTTNHNLLVLVIAALGTSPVVGTPAGWTSVRANSGATLSFAMFILPNNPGGATNPSSTLTGTITGWVAAMFEFNTTGTNEGLLNSAANGFGAATSLPNIFVGISQPPIPLLFVYSVARATATITPQNTGLNWSNSVQPQAGVQGLSLDTYWGSSQNIPQSGLFQPPYISPFGPPYAAAAGILGSSVAAVQIGAMLNSAAIQGFVLGPEQGPMGNFVGPFYQGSLGG